MKKAIFLFITIVSVVNLSAQTPHWTFANNKSQQCAISYGNGQPGQCLHLWNLWANDEH